MRLSEAVRLGAMQVAPTIDRHKVFERDGEDAICGACVLGTAAVAIGIVRNGWYGQAIDGTGLFIDQFPIGAVRVPSPHHGISNTLAYVASSLYESYGWTREQVADWVETIEAAQPTHEPVAVERDPVRCE